MKGNVFSVILGIAYTAVATSAPLPMPATTPEEIIALAHRTYDYVARSVPEKELAALKDELAIDEKWYADAKKANDAREMRNAVRELKSVRRRILFKHPDLQFKRLLAVQRGLPFSQESGTTDQYAGRWSRPGPGLIALDNWQEAPHKTVLLKDKLPWGTVLNPDLHWDGDRVLFAFCDHTRKPEADPKACGAPAVVKLEDQRLDWLRRVDPGNPNFASPDGQFSVMHHRYFIYEAAADGSWVRQLTGVPGDPMKTWEGRQTILLEDADPCYLPDGGFVFNSTRCQTIARCHSGRYVPAWLLYRAELPPLGAACARNIRQLSWGEANEWEPVVLNDGRICYTRWDYINRHAVWFSSLWTTKPDGTAVSHYYGNYSKTIFTTTEVKPIPGSPLVVATAAPHHLFSSGSLVLIDTRKGEDGEAPLTRLTPECPFPEAEGWKGNGLWCGPMPVNDTLFFASYSPDTTQYPKGHPRFHSHSWTAAWPDPRSFGVWLVDTLGGRELIYQDPEWSTFNPIPLVKRPKPPALVSTLPPADKAPASGLCYVENVYDARVELPKGSVKSLRINRLFNQGAVRHWSWNQGGDLDIYKESLGTVPVAEDGSAAFRIPAEMPIQLQALDKDGMAIYTMRSFIYAQKGEIQGCTGCHENKMASVAPAKMPANRRVYDPVPEVDLGYHGPFSYPRSVQPIFDRHCISCHGLGKAPNFIGTNGIRRLVKDKQVSFAKSYAETIESKPYDYFAAPSPLTKRLKAGHGGAKLSPDEWKTLIIWMDFNVPEWNIGGGYSWNRPELRETDPTGEQRLRAAIREKLGDAIAAQPFEALVNRGDETKSRILWLVKPEERDRFLELVRGALVNSKWHDIDGTCGRPVEDGCECNSCWVRRGRFNGSFLSTHAPTFWHGGEFPGATGRVEVVHDELRLHYDFTGGGHYVAARFGLPERPKAKRIAFEANLPESTEITVRIVDSTGQTFQYGFSGSTDGEWEEFSFVTEGIGARWGGANDGLLHLPLTEFAVLAENRGGATDVLRLRNIRFFERAELPQKMPEQPFDKAATEAGRLRDDLAHALPDLKRKGLGTKTRASLAVMDNFQSWIREDLARGFTNRAVRETHELVTVGREAKARLQAIAEGKVRDEPVPHFVTGPVETSHAQIIGTRAWPDGRRERGNVMLTGFGHFGKVQREQEKLPPLGNHIIQMEIGPWSVLKDEHVVDTNGLAPFFRAAALGAKENVQICLLLSPHYFPQWALKKWPHLSGCAGGFFKYCVHDEHAQAVIEKYLRTVIPLVRGNPALHSICLSNEPEQGHFGPDCALRKKWPGWLEKRHGTIAALNAKWGTSYASFADVPMPKSFKGNPATPATLDFVRFSRESFTAFHRRMADVIHELAPELPVHAKIMIFADFGNNATSYSVDPAAFAQLGAYNGNDAYVSYRGDQMRGDNTRGWVHDWWTMEAGYDYQRSAADKPVFNTENHIISDRERRNVPGRHVYAALWQNAVHGQSATTHWVWERAYDDGKSDFNGLILERPACLAAWAHASLDLNRLADALAPIQNQEPTILLHRSLSSEILGRQNAFLSCYRAASFLGQPLGVVTEEMLAEYARTGVRTRPLAAARVILLPRVTHLPDMARDGLKKLAAQGVKVFACRGKPAFDDCYRPRNADDFPYLDAPSEKRLALLFAERAGEWNLPDFPRVRAVDSEKGVYGVESHGYRTNGVSRVTFINHRAKPVRVRLEAPGRDLLSGTAVPQTLDLPTGVPYFVEY